MATEANQKLIFQLNGWTKRESAASKKILIFYFRNSSRLSKTTRTFGNTIQDVHPGFRILIFYPSRIPGKKSTGFRIRIHNTAFSPLGTSLRTRLNTEITNVVHYRELSTVQQRWILPQGLVESPECDFNVTSVYQQDESHTTHPESPEEK